MRDLHSQETGFAIGKESKYTTINENIDSAPNIYAKIFYGQNRISLDEYLHSEMGRQILL